MSKIKIVFYLVVVFIVYKGFVAIKNFEIGVDKRVAQIEELAEIEKEGEVIGLMMYLGDPPELKEHLFTESRSKCLELNKGTTIRASSGTPIALYPIKILFFA